MKELSKLSTLGAALVSFQSVRQIAAHTAPESVPTDCKFNWEAYSHQLVWERTQKARAATRTKRKSKKRQADASRKRNRQ